MSSLQPEGRFIVTNILLCDECFVKTDGVEKCCTHGMFAKRCSQCGRDRRAGEHFHCRGQVEQASEEQKP